MLSQVIIPSTSEVDVTSIALVNPGPLMYSQSSPFIAVIKSMSPNTAFPCTTVSLTSGSIASIMLRYGFSWNVSITTKSAYIPV